MTLLIIRLGTIVEHRAVPRRGIVTGNIVREGDVCDLMVRWADSPMEQAHCKSEIRVIGGNAEAEAIAADEPEADGVEGDVEDN